MSFREISTQRYKGFFDYSEGNVITGHVVEENITGKNDSGKDMGYIAIKLTESCAAKLDDVSFTAEPGEVIALTITDATRVIIGLKQGTAVRATFEGFKKNKRNPQKNYHAWKVEIDDGT